MGYYDAERNAAAATVLRIDLESPGGASESRRDHVVGGRVKRLTLTGSSANHRSKTIGSPRRTDINTAHRCSSPCGLCRSTAPSPSPRLDQSAVNHLAGYVHQPDLCLWDCVIVGDKSQRSSIRMTSPRWAFLKACFRHGDLRFHRGANGWHLSTKKAGRVRAASIYNSCISWSEYERKMKYNERPTDLRSADSTPLPTIILRKPGGGRSLIIHHTSHQHNVQPPFSLLTNKKHSNPVIYDWLDAVSKRFGANHTLDFSGVRTRLSTTISA